MIEVETAGALSAIKLLEAIEALYCALALIHVVLDDARDPHPPDHGPGVAPDWLAQPGRRVALLISEAHQTPLMRGESPNDHPAILPAHAPVE
ncbi:MAG: hypothetical protein ACREDJ_02255 [Methylocella sp.]